LPLARFAEEIGYEKLNRPKAMLPQNRQRIFKDIDEAIIEREEDSFWAELAGSNRSERVRFKIFRLQFSYLLREEFRTHI
jgi:hypothetical protein